jgi:hypothetical protein
MVRTKPVVFAKIRVNGTCTWSSFPLPSCAMAIHDSLRHPVRRRALIPIFVKAESVQHLVPSLIVQNSWDIAKSQIAEGSFWGKGNKNSQKTWQSALLFFYVFVQESMRLYYIPEGLSSCPIFVMAESIQHSVPSLIVEEPDRWRQFWGKGRNEATDLARQKRQRRWQRLQFIRDSAILDS